MDAPLQDTPLPTVRIDGIAAGGAGVGRLPDGRAVFVHRTAPGELVRIQVTDSRRRWARGRLVELLQPSAERREAPCPHYDRCGGCTLEHLSYGAQLRAKARIIADACARIGGAPVAEPEVAASPVEVRYRNRVSFTLLRLGAGRVVAGFHEIDVPSRIFDVTGGCLLPEPALATTWDALRGAWGPDAELLPGGARLRLTLRSSADGRVALLIEGGGDGRGRAEELARRVPDLSAIWWRRRPGSEPAHLAGNARIAESWGDEELGLTGTVFLQVNRAAAALLEAHVLSLAGDVAGAEVVDAYCGVGLHARRLARAGARVTGIELDAAAIAEAQRDAPAGARFVRGRVEAELPALLPADLVIVNPPRAGLDAAVTDALVATPAGRIIYVSCDPATLARDLARLRPTYTLLSLHGFDLFPQTAHVETVVEMACSTT